MRCWAAEGTTERMCIESKSKRGMIFHKCSCCWCRHRKTGRDKRESYLFSIYFFFFFFDFYHKSYSSSSLIVHSWQMNAAASWPFILLVVCFLILFSSSFKFSVLFSFSSLFSSPSAAGQRPAQQSAVGAPFFSAIAVVMIVTVTCFLAMDHHGRVTSASPLMGYQRREREITTTKTEGLWHVIA